MANWVVVLYHGGQREGPSVAILSFNSREPIGFRFIGYNQGNGEDELQNMLRPHEAYNTDLEGVPKSFIADSAVDWAPIGDGPALKATMKLGGWSADDFGYFRLPVFMSFKKQDNHMYLAEILACGAAFVLTFIFSIFLS